MIAVERRVRLSGGELSLRVEVPDDAEPDPEGDALIAELLRTVADFTGEGPIITWKFANTAGHLDREHDAPPLRQACPECNGRGWRINPDFLGDPLHPFMPTGEDQPFRDWLDFVDRVARPIVETENDDEAEQAAMVLYRKASPFFISAALVMAANRADIGDGVTELSEEDAVVIRGVPYRVSTLRQLTEDGTVPVVTLHAIGSPDEGGDD